MGFDGAVLLLAEPPSAGRRLVALGVTRRIDSGGCPCQSYRGIERDLLPRYELIEPSVRRY